jgi:hypothetical protein
MERRAIKYGEATSWIIHLVSDRLSNFCHLKGKLT